MDFLPLEIFPGGGFDSSILTIVFAGVVLRWVLTETLGYSFVGLVVPGYLASVMIISPTSAAVAIVEALCTYGIVWVLSEVLGALKAWSMVFGRDRFFAFLVVSIVVRIVGELWLWPASWTAVTQWFEISPYLPGPLNSIGLVIVPLAANMFWKLGFQRGAWQVLAPTLIIYAIFQWGVLAWTNLRVAEFQVHYEDIAIDLFASPKAYIVLLTTAAIAARVNLKVGWDFGGILVPALIAIAWYDVDKALLTIGEGVVLAGVVALVLRAGPMRQMNLEGPRKIVLVFAVGYLLKFGSSWLVISTFSEIRLADFFGFGYLLSSLIALKIVEQSSVMLVVVPTLLISIVGFVVGGFIADVMTPPRTIDEGVADVEEHVVDGERQAIDVELLRRSALVGTRPTQGTLQPREVDRLEGISETIESVVAEGGALSGAVGDALDGLGLNMWTVDDGGQTAIMIGEPLARYPDHRGLGLYVIRPDADGPVVTVPDGVEEPGQMAAVWTVARDLEASALLFGARSRAPTGREVMSRQDVNAPMHRFFRPYRDREVLQVQFDASADSALWMGRRVSQAFDVAAVTRYLAEPAIHWRPRRQIDYQREIARQNYVTLQLGDDATARLATENATGTWGGQWAEEAEQAPTLQAALEDYLVGGDRRIATHLRELEDPLEAAELEALSEGLVTRLGHLAGHPRPRFSQRRQMAMVERIAESWQLELTTVHTEYPRACWQIIAESEQPLRGLGLLVMRCQGSSPLVIEVPRPLEETGTWRMAAVSARDLDARALLIGSSFRSRDDGELLLAEPLVEPSFPGAARRAIVEGMQRERPLAVQMRGVSSERAMGYDAVFSQDTALWGARRGADVEAVEAFFSARGMSTDFDDGQLEYAALRGIEDRTAAYFRQIADDGFVRMWLSAPFRNALLSRPDAESMRRLVQRYDWRSKSGPVLQVAERIADDNETAFDGNLVERMEGYIDGARNFARTENPVDLAVIIDELGADGVEPVVVIDDARDQVWLVAADDGDKRRRVAGVRLQQTASDATLKLSSDRRIAETSLMTSPAFVLDVDAGGRR